MKCVLCYTDALLLQVITPQDHAKIINHLCEKYSYSIKLNLKLDFNAIILIILSNKDN